MAQQYSEISDRLAGFIADQHMFFVATARPRATGA